MQNTTDLLVHIHAVLEPPLGRRRRQRAGKLNVPANGRTLRDEGQPQKQNWYGKPVAPASAWPRLQGKNGNTAVCKGKTQPGQALA